MTNPSSNVPPSYGQSITGPNESASPHTSPNSSANYATFPPALRPPLLSQQLLFQSSSPTRSRSPGHERKTPEHLVQSLFNTAKQSLEPLSNPNTIVLNKFYHKHFLYASANVALCQSAYDTNCDLPDNYQQELGELQSKIKALAVQFAPYEFGKAADKQIKDSRAMLSQKFRDLSYAEVLPSTFVKSPFLLSILKALKISSPAFLYSQVLPSSSSSFASTFSVEAQDQLDITSRSLLQFLQNPSFVMDKILSEAKFKNFTVTPTCKEFQKELEILAQSLMFLVDKSKPNSETVNAHLFGLFAACLNRPEKEITRGLDRHDAQTAARVISFTGLCDEIKAGRLDKFEEIKEEIVFRTQHLNRWREILEKVSLDPSFKESNRGLLNTLTTCFNSLYNKSYLLDTKEKKHFALLLQLLGDTWEAGEIAPEEIDTVTLALYTLFPHLNFSCSHFLNRWREVLEVVSRDDAFIENNRLLLDTLAGCFHSLLNRSPLLDIEEKSRFACLIQLLENSWGRGNIEQEGIEAITHALHLLFPNLISPSVPLYSRNENPPTTWVRELNTNLSQVRESLDQIQNSLVKAIHTLPFFSILEGSVLNKHAIVANHVKRIMGGNAWPWAAVFPHWAPLKVLDAMLERLGRIRTRQSQLEQLELNLQKLMRILPAEILPKGEDDQKIWKKILEKATDRQTVYLPPGMGEKLRPHILEIKEIASIEESKNLVKRSIEKEQEALEKNLRSLPQPMQEALYTHFSALYSSSPDATGPTRFCSPEHAGTAITALKEYRSGLQYTEAAKEDFVRQKKELQLTSDSHSFILFPYLDLSPITERAQLEKICKPKSLVYHQLHALIAMVQGTTEQHTSRVAVVTTTGSNGQRTTSPIDLHFGFFSTQNTFEDIIIWQLDLEECGKPFPAELVTLLRESDILDNALSCICAHKLPALCVEKAKERIKNMKTFFKGEDAAQRSPRDLFFALFGGRDRYESLKGTVKFDMFSGILAGKSSS